MGSINLSIYKHDPIQISKEDEIKKGRKKHKVLLIYHQDPREFCLIIHVVLLYVGLNTEGRQVAMWDCRSQQGKAILKVIMFIASKTRLKYIFCFSLMKKANS